MSLFTLKPKYAFAIKQFQRSMALLTAALILFSSSAFALPTGWEVIEGNVTVDVTDNIMTITSISDTAVINYITFDLANGETINFIMPNAGASILNRVIGGDISNIAGTINASGRLGIINSAGINIANTAQIQSAALLASTLNISNDSFFSDVISASKNPDNIASIINEGNIDITDGGYALFVANSIVNTGQIIAEDGTIHMAVGDKVTFHLSDNSSVKVTIDEEITTMVASLNSAITNHGDIQAHSVELRTKLSKSLLKQSINNTGIIQGTALDNVGGKIVIRDDQGIVSNTGLVYAGATQNNATAGSILIRGQSVYNGGALMAQSGQGKTGGTVHMLGDTVINEGGFIDVSGDLGGGEALIGGDFQGKGDTYTAKLNMADENTVVLADAYSKGDGGKVIFWSDKDTFFYGDVKARGGLDVGDGGFTEVSGHRYLDMKGDVDLTASNGNKGTLLLDPTNILITEFDPSDPANLEMWFDADDTGTIATSGSDLTQWNDKSGNGYHAQQGTGSRRPTSGTSTINGKNTISFNGSSDYLAISGKSYTNPSEVSGLSLFSVQRANNTGRNIVMSYDRSEVFRYTIGDDTLGNNGYVGFDTSAPGEIFRDMRSTTLANGANGRLTGAQFDGATGAKSVYVDGQSTGTATAGGTHAPGSALGTGVDRFGFIGTGSEAPGFDGATGPANLMQGDIGEILMYERALSYDETMQVNQYLAAKWGVAFNESLANISVFNDTFLEYLTQTSDVSLLADQNITIDDMSDNLLALGNRNLTLTATSGNITFNDTNDVIRTEGGDVTFNAGNNITIGHIDTRGAAGNVANGNITLNGGDAATFQSLNTQNGNITVTADYNGDGNGGITLDAAYMASINANGGDLHFAGELVNVNTNISSGGGNITIEADQNADGSGRVNFNSGAIVNSGGGDVNISGDELTLDSAGAGIIAGAGDVTLTDDGVNDNNDVRLNNGFSITGVNLTINGTADVTGYNNSSLTMTGTVNVTAGDDIDFNSTDVLATSTINMAAADNFNARDITSTGSSITLVADNDNAGSGTLNIAAGDNLNANGNTVTLEGHNVTIAENIATAGGNLIITANRGGTGSGTVNLNNNAQLTTANGNAQISGDRVLLDGGGTSRLITGNGNIVLVDNGTTNNEDVRLDNGFTMTGRNLTVNSNHGFYTLGGSTINMTGITDINANGSNLILDNSSLTSSGVVTLDSSDIIDIRNGSTINTPLSITANAGNYMDVDNSTITSTGAFQATTINDFNMIANGTINSSSTITVNAGDDLNGNNGIFSATGNIILNANDNLDVMDVATTAGNITISADQNLDNVGNFTLRAGNNINANGGNLLIRGENITLQDDIISGGGNVDLIADRNVNGTGQINMQAGSDINTGNGDLTMTGADHYFDGASGSTIVVGTGDISITETASTDGNDIRFNNGFALSGRNITFNAANDIQMDNNSTVTASGFLTMTAGDDIDIDGGDIAANGGHLTLVADDHINTRGVAVALGTSNITMRADEDTNGTGNVNVNAGDILQTNGGNVVVMGENVNINDDVSTSGGDITLTANRNADAAGNIDFADDANLNSANGDISLTATDLRLDGAGTAGIDAGTGDVYLTDNGSTDSYDIYLNNGFTVTGRNLIAVSNHDFDVLNAADVTMSGTIDVTAGDEVNAQTGSMNATGNIDLNANSHIDVMDVNTTSGNITISADHDVNGSGNFRLNVGANINTNGGDLTILGETLNIDQDIVSGGGDVTLTANRDGATGEGLINFNNAAEITSGNGDINLTAADFLFDGTGASGLTAGTGDVNITENGNVDGNDVRFNNAFFVTASNITINSDHDVDLLNNSTLTATNAIVINADDDINLTSGTVTAGTTLNVTSLDNVNANGAVLSANGNVTLRADDNVIVTDVTTATGNIILAADEDLNNVGNFTLNTGTNINTNGGNLDILGNTITFNDIAQSGGGMITITGDRGGNGTGTFDMNNGGSGIQSGNGNVIVSAAELILNGDLGNNVFNAGTGNITLTETASSDSNDLLVQRGLNIIGRNIVMTAANDIVMQDDSLLTSSGFVTMTAGDDINTNGGDITAAGNVTLTANDHINVRDISSTNAAGNISLLADNDTNDTGNITIAAGDNLVTTGGDLTMRGENITYSEVTNTAGGDIVLQANRNNGGAEGNVNFGGVGALTSGNGNVTISGADIMLDNAGGFINAGTGDITLTENGTVDGNDLRLRNDFTLTGRHIDMDSNADIDIQNNATITASGNLTMDAADTLVATSGTGSITATGNVIGNAGSNITASNITAGQNLGLVGAGNVVINGAGIEAQGSTGWNGGSDETMVVWSTGGSVTGTGFRTTGSGNVRVQAGSTGNLAATNYIDLNDVSATQNASFFSTGANGGRAIRVDGNSNVAGYIVAGGLNASNNITGTNGDIILQMNSGNLTTGLAWSNANDITLTANNGSLLQSASGFPWTFNGKTIFTQGGNVALTANGGAGSYIDTGVIALGAGSNLTARASGRSGGNLSVQLFGRADGNLAVYNTSGGGNAVTGNVNLGTGIGGDADDLNDVYTVMDVTGTTSVRALGNVNLYGYYGGSVSIYNANAITAVADKGNLNLNSINAGNNINLTSVRGTITGSNVNSTGGGNIYLQAGSEHPRDKMSYITINNLNTTGNLDVVVAGSTDGTTSGNSVVITGGVGGATTVNHTDDNTKLGNVVTP